MGASLAVDRLGQFVVDASSSDLGSSLPMLKRNVLDSIACALGALDGEMIPTIRAHAEQFSSRPTATFIGGGRASVDQAAFFNAVLVRYPDLLDTFLTPGGLCHPADNFGAVLAVAEHVGATGADFLLALAVAYEVQCRFSAQVPVMARGLNHALQLAMSVAAGAAKLLELDAEKTASAIAAASADNVSLAAIHAEPVSTWKGISPAITGMRAVYVTMLAGRGIGGPRALIDGPNGLVQLFEQSIDFRTDDPRLNAVQQTYLKQYCSLIHGQNIIDATHDRGGHLQTELDRGTDRWQVLRDKQKAVGRHVFRDGIQLSFRGRQNDIHVQGKPDRGPQRSWIKRILRIGHYGS